MLVHISPYTEAQNDLHEFIEKYLKYLKNSWIDKSEQSIWKIHSIHS